MDLIQKYNADNGSFIEECKKLFSIKENGDVDFSTDYQNITININDLTAEKLGIRL